MARASQLLLYVGRANKGHTASEVARAFGISLPTVYHLLNTLVCEGLLWKGDDKRYVLGPAVDVLCEQFSRRYSPPHYLQATLQKLAQTTQETVFVSAWRGGEVTILASIEGTRRVRVQPLRPGFRGYAHARASGKVLLAFTSDDVTNNYLERHELDSLTEQTVTSIDEFKTELATVRQRGYATNLEEFQAGVASIGVPVLAGDIAIAVLSVAVPSTRFPTEQHELLAALKAAAQEAGIAQPTTPHTATNDNQP